MRRARSIAEASRTASTVASVGDSPDSDPLGPEGTWGVDTVSSRALQSGANTVGGTCARPRAAPPYDETTRSIRPSVALLCDEGRKSVNARQGHRLGEGRRRMRGRIVVTGVLLAALAVSACGSGTSTAKPKSTTPGSTTPTDTKLGVGVTDDSIKLGISLVNFDCIKQYTDQIRVGQK